MDFGDLMGKLIIFDYDGTIVQTLDVFKESLKELIRKLGLKPGDFSKEEFEYMAKHTPKIWLPKILSKIPENKRPNPNYVLEVFKRIYSEKHLKLIRPVNGIREVLSELKRKGYVLVLTTGRVLVSEYVEEELKYLGLDKYFDLIYVPNSSDKVRTLGTIVKMFNTKECIIVGDSVDDIKAGKLLGLKTVAVLYGFTNANELIKCGPDHVVKTATELINLV